jgi:hypothetical protein
VERAVTADFGGEVMASVRINGAALGFWVGEKVDPQGTGRKPGQKRSAEASTLGSWRTSSR